MSSSPSTDVAPAPATVPAVAGLPARMLLPVVLALAGLLVLWEVWLAPIRAGGSWLALKALPLALAVPGLRAGRTYTRQWLSLLLPFYLAEGIVRIASETGRVRLLAGAEILLALAAFGAILALARQARRAAAESRSA